MPRASRADLATGFEVDPLAAHLAGERVADQRVELRQHAVLHGQQADLGAERPQHSGQFYADVTAADDGDPRRLLGQCEEAVRGDAELGTRQWRHDRLAAGGDDNVRRAVQRFADRDR